MSLNGSIIELSAGEYTATLASSGATLVALKHAGRDLVVPFDPATEIGLGYCGRTLAPWPNRISDARYTFDGAEHAVPVNEPATGAALHGLACFENWAVSSIGPQSVFFALELPRTDGYPFDLRLSARYLVDADEGLFALVSATNQGRTDAPVGLSAHPYLTCGVPVDECVFGLDAAQVLLVDEKMRPVGLADVDDTAFDFRTPAFLDGRHVDNAYTGLPEGGWIVVLTHPERGGVTLASDAPWVQAFTGDIPGLDRGGVAVEPMTCPPDAFNSHPDDVRLHPGETRTLRYAIRAV